MKNTNQRFDITPRVPLIDWRNEFPQHWNGGDPSATHLFNAFSFLFPQGETFFISIAKTVHSKLKLESSSPLNIAAKSFVRQETMHTKYHEQYNAILEKQGYINITYNLLEWIIKQAHRHFSPTQNLAIVCAFEHYTAILGNYVLSHPQILKSATKKMQLIWGWHATEETEHKAVCYDLYQAAGGGWLLRILAFFIVSLEFGLLFSCLYLNLLWRDGCLYPSKIFKTLWQSTKLFWGRHGISWHLLWHGIQYLKPGFHPWDQDNQHKIQKWLAVNKNSLKNI